MADLTETQELTIDMREVKKDVHSMKESLGELTHQLAQLLEFRTELKTQEKSHLETIQRLFLRLEAVEKQSADNSQEFAKWLNRGVGGWIVFSVLIMGIFSLLHFKFLELNEQIKENSIEVQNLREKNIEFEQRLRQLGVKETKVSSRCAGEGKLPPECYEDYPAPTPMPNPPPRKPIISES